MDKLMQVKAWNMILEHLGRIRDNNLRTAMLQEYRERAQADWGWIPDGTSAEMAKPELTAEQEEFYKAIQAAVKYKLDIHKRERPKLHQEFVLEMMAFIREGGTLSDIPDDVRSDTVDKMYWWCMDIIGRDTLAAADNIINKGVKNG